MNNDVKTFSYLAYIGPLFLIGLCSDLRTEQNLRFHLNQGFVLFLCEVAAMIVHFLIDSLIGGVLILNLIPKLLFTAIGLGSLVLTLIGIFNVATDKKTPLPFIGTFNILK